MLKRATLLGFGLVGCLFGQAPGLVREQIVVNGETWRLEWKKPPIAACGPRQQEAFSCLCAGFAYGQSGELELVRERTGKVLQRLDLGQFFEGRIAQVQIHEKRPRDIEKMPMLSQEVANRPVTRVMKLGDYNHDGQATEFLLQTSAGCGSSQGIAIGVTTTNPKAHALGSLDHPTEPLVMRVKDWEAIRDSKASVHTVVEACSGGAREQLERTIAASAKGIVVEEQKYACSEGGAKGKLVGIVKR